MTKTDEYYEGQILFALEVGAGGIGHYPFYEFAQGFYLLFNSELDSYTPYITDTVGSFFDNTVLSFYDTYGTPIYFGLNAPSFTTADMNASNASSAIISSTNPTYNSGNVNLDVQTQFYFAYLNAISSRGWIAGVASRGFFPAMQMTDFSSSIYGKPAFTLFHNQ